MLPSSPFGDAQGGAGMDSEGLRYSDYPKPASVLSADISDVAFGKLGSSVMLSAKISPASLGDTMPLVLGRAHPSEICEPIIARVAVDMVGLLTVDWEANERLEYDSVNEFSRVNCTDGEHNHLVAASPVVWSDDSTDSQLRTLSVASDYPVQRADSTEVGDFVGSLEANHRKPSFWGILCGSHSRLLGVRWSGLWSALITPRSPFCFGGILA